MYLPTLTNEELLRYAVPETELEKELLKRWKGVLQEFMSAERTYEQEIVSLNKEIQHLEFEMSVLEESLYGD